MADEPGIAGRLRRRSTTSVSGTSHRGATDREAPRFRLVSNDLTAHSVAERGKALCKTSRVEHDRWMPNQDGQPRKFRVLAGNVHALLDTNVVLELCSVHDLLNANAAHEMALAADAKMPAAEAARAGHDREQRERHRVFRAADALAMAIHLHEIGAFTMCLEEALNVLIDRVRPQEHPMATNYVVAFQDFVRPTLLPGWTLAKVPSIPKTLAGNAADAALVEQARKYGWPLITNEGNTVNGPQDVRLRKLAKEAGVQVFTPGEFVRGRLRKGATRDFLERFRLRRSDYCKGKPEFTVAQQTLDGMYEQFRLLLGESR